MQRMREKDNDFIKKLRRQSSVLEKRIATMSSASSSVLRPNIKMRLDYARQVSHRSQTKLAHVNEMKDSPRLSDEEKEALTIEGKNRPNYVDYQVINEYGTRFTGNYEEL